MMGDSDSGKRITEMVDFACLRPMPSKILNHRFRMGDSVDVFCDNGWQKGTVKDLLGNFKYVVGFDGKSLGIVAEQSNLRLHHEWHDGIWVPSHIENKSSSEINMKPKKLRVKMKYKRRETTKPEPIFETGTRVEIRSDEEGYVGAWYDATIVGDVGNNVKYVVEYLNLLTDDETALVREMVTHTHIRPCPPPVPSEVSFQQLENVDAWFNDGWWEGMISKVLNESKYMVYFSCTDETMEFEHSLLRHHQDWIDGEWKKKEKSTKDSKRNPSEMFGKGAKVEVKSDEVGFQGAWFGATIVDVMESGKFVIQYHDLLTEDGIDFLKEEAKSSDIRPIPPSLSHLHPFRLLEVVDAWCNEGWWVGRISRVLMNSKYNVYFKNTEESQFEHSELRPHQEYIDGKWVTVPMDWQF